MKRTDVINIYPMESLIPIVGGLAEKFTSGGSSSITYERAKQLMEAVLYCISHFDAGDSSLISADILPAEEAYRQGLQAVVEKVKSTQLKYNSLMEFFDHYGNRNYRDTVLNALPGFFLYYDVWYAPMENIITMDYPVFGLDMELEGIDMICEYIDAIWEEQCYLLQFQRACIINKLRSYHPHYEREFINIKEIFDSDK